MDELYYGFGQFGVRLYGFFTGQFLEGLAVVTVIGVISAISFVMLLKGIWIPLIPGALALVVTSSSVVIYSISQGSNSSINLSRQERSEQA